MALSLREKLQQASQANIATNAAKTLEKLDIMERPATQNAVSEPEDTKATQPPTHSTTQLPSKRPTKLPTEPPNYPVAHPLDYPVDDPTTQSPTHSTTQSSAHPVDDPLNYPVDHSVNNPGVKSDLWDMLTGPQKRVLAFLVGRQGEIVRYAEITRGTSVPAATAQTVCKRLKALGVLSSQYGCRGVIKGMRFSLDKRFLGGPIQLANPVDYPVDDPEDHPLNYPLNYPGGDPAPHSTTQSATQLPFMKIDREDLNLSISSEVIQTTWPNLARCGFGVEQVQQITANLTAIGKPTDRIVQGLDHLEYELANDQLVDKSGQPVADPCSWAFRALAQNGYYRRPKGYVSPEEQAAKDAEEEARAVIAARQRAEQSQFEAWRAGLSPEELEEAMMGHPGGNKDAWLRKVWKGRGSKL